MLCQMNRTDCVDRRIKLKVVRIEDVGTMTGEVGSCVLSNVESCKRAIVRSDPANCVESRSHNLISVDTIAAII